MAERSHGRREEPWFPLCLPSSLQPARLHLRDQPPSRPSLQRMLGGHSQAQAAGTWGDTPPGTCGCGHHQARRPPTWSEAGLGRTHVPAQGREGGRMGEGSPQLIFFRELRATNRSTVKIASLEANKPCVNSLQPSQKTGWVVPLLLKQHYRFWGCGERHWPSEAPPSTQWRDCSQGHGEKGLRSYIHRTRTLEHSHPG